MSSRASFASILIARLEEAAANPCRWVGPPVVMASAVWLWLTGVVGVGRTGSRWLADLDWFLAAGQLWLDGHNPYDAESFSVALAHVGGREVGIALSYPPQFAPWCMGLALLPHASARWVMVGLGLGSILALGWLTAWLVTAAEPTPASRMAATRWLLPAIVIGSPFAAHLLWLGQMTPLAVVLLVGGWVALRRGAPVWGGVLLGLATFKPQLVLLPILWVVLERRIRTLVALAATSGACALVGLGVREPLVVLRQWLVAVSDYQVDVSNHLGGEFVVGLPSLLVALGMPPVHLWMLPLLGVALVLVLFRFRRHVVQDDLLAWLVCIQCLAVWVHSNDLILLAPVAAALWRRLAHRRELWAPALLGLSALYLPQRLVRMTGVPLLHHWRTLVVGVAACALARPRPGERAVSR